MQVLKYIEDKFNKQTIRVKVELFLIPLLLFILYLSLSSSFEEKTNLNFEKTKPLAIKKVKINLIDVLKSIEEFSKANKIEIQNISNNNNSIDVIVNTSLKKQFEFLLYLEKYNNYSSIDYIEQNNKELKIKLSFKTLYAKKDIDITKSLEHLKNEYKSKYKLHAIVGDSALINDKWTTLGEAIDLNYVLHAIEVNRIFLKSKNKMIELEL